MTMIALLAVLAVAGILGTIRLTIVDRSRRVPCRPESEGGLAER